MENLTEDSQEDAAVQEQQFYYSNNGENYKTLKMANFAIEKRGLDPDVHKAIEVKNDKKEVIGYCIQFMEFGVPEKYRGYWLVKFNAKATPNDTDDVQLMVNGETLIMQREKEVVLPGRFLENADHATYLHFRQVPHQPRKVVGKIKTFPYERIRKVTKKEFLHQRTEGTKKTRQNIKRYGYDVDPEDLTDE